MAGMIENSPRIGTATRPAVRRSMPRLKAGHNCIGSTKHGGKAAALWGAAAFHIGRYFFLLPFLAFFAIGDHPAFSSDRQVNDPLT